MTSIRVGNGKIKSNILIGSVIAAMIAAMVTTKMAISGNTAAKAQDMMQMPYVKAFAGNALYKPDRCGAFRGQHPKRSATSRRHKDLSRRSRQNLTPPLDDLSLTKVPPVDYAQLMDQGVDAMEPLPQSTVWSADNPT